MEAELGSGTVDDEWIKELWGPGQCGAVGWSVILKTERLWVVYA